MNEKIEVVVREIRKLLEDSFKSDVMAGWYILDICGEELLVCDMCFKNIYRQRVRICSKNSSKKVICEECWKRKAESEAKEG